MASQILGIASRYSFYSTGATFIVGSIGHALNILVFTNLKLFRGNRCVFYLIVESAISIVLLFQVWCPQIFHQVYGIDPKDYALFWCKIRTIFGQSCRLTISYIVCFEAIDQFLSTSPHYHLRQLSTLKTAQRLVLTSLCFWISHGIPFIFFSEIVPPFGCIIVNKGLVLYYSYIYYPFINGLIPISISCVFAILAYSNVRRLVRQQIPIQRRRLDRQLTVMLLARITTFVLFASLYAIYRIFMLNVTFTPTNPYPYAINQLFSAFADSALVFSLTFSFYLFFAISSRFRRQVKYFFGRKCFPWLKRCCHLNHNEVHPEGDSPTASAMELA